MDNGGSVRMGPISLFSLIILICLAVLAVLTLSTAQATYSSAEKQKYFTSDTYANEVAAQELVAKIDKELSSARSSGDSKTEVLAELKDILPAGTIIEDSTIDAYFEKESGRSLSVVITITDDLKYSISSWRATTHWSQDSDSETLWTGSAS